MTKFPGIRGRTLKLLDGNEIPLFGLGTYTLWNESEMCRAIDVALANGYRLFDTANFYQNEKELGAAFEKCLPKHGLKRENIFITTKANIRSPNVRENAKQMVEHSLRALRTDYLDLMLIHYPKDWGVSDKHKSNAADRLEMYTVFEEYRDVGKIRSIGVSNFEARHIDELWGRVRYQPTVNQCEFHPHLTRSDLLDYCRQKRILFQAHTSLAKHSKVLYDESVLKQIAQRHNATIPQVLLAFAYCQDVAVIPKSGDPQRIADNAKAVDVALSAEELDQLMSLNRDRRHSDCDGWNVS